MEGVFTVIIINGEAVDLCDQSTDALRYDNMFWVDAVELVRLSFEQGYQAVLWKQAEEDLEEEDADECGTA